QARRTPRADAAQLMSMYALETFGETLFAQNPCRRASAAVVWRAPSAATEAALVEQFAFVRAPIDAFKDDSNADPADIVRFRSDWYFCAGAQTLGSGRSIIIDGKQVKGVGRTVQAPLTGIALMTDGRVRPYKAVDELVRGLLVD